jgi:hypothetical protein
MPDEPFRAFPEEPLLQASGTSLLLLLAVSGLVCGITALVLKSRKTRDHRPYARWARTLGGAVLLLSVLGVLGFFARK